MKYLFYSFFTLNTCVLFSQNIGSNGVKSDSRISDLFELIKNRIDKNSNTNSKVKGSEYFDDKFKSADVRYFGKDLNQNIFLRYNAYKDEIEFTNNPKTVSSDKILMKHTNISCQIESNKYNYVNYVDDKNIKQKGYLVELFLGTKYKFCEKRIKIFMEGSEAKTSLERSFPPRYVKKFKYFISINKSMFKEIRLNKKSIINILDEEPGLLKKIIKEKKLKFKKPSDILEVLVEINKN